MADIFYGETNRRIEGGYTVFRNEDSRREIVEIGRKVDKYVHDRGIQDVIFVDRSARPGYISVLENWKRMYPEDPPPNIYFMSPKGFRSLEEINDDHYIVAEDREKSLLKGDRNESTRLIRSKRRVQEDLRTTYPELFSVRGRHVLLFDTCIHSGDSVRPMLETLTELGLDVRLGVVTARRNRGEVPVDLEILDNRPEGGCYPFEHDRLVEKSYGSVHAVRSKNQSDINYSRRIRADMKRAISEYYD